jgi:hypothetical protein
MDDGRCLEPEEILSVAVGDESAGSAARSAHLAGCAHCRRVIAEVSRTLSRGRPRPAGRERRLIRGFPVLAAAALGLLLGIAASSSLNQTLILGPLAAIPRAVRPATAEPSSGIPDHAGVVRANGESLKTCYRRALERNELPRNFRLEVHVRVAASGAVERVTTSVESKGRLLGDCVQDEVARWAFPPSGTAYEITFPLIMQPLLTATGIPSAQERRRLED